MPTPNEQGTPSKHDSVKQEDKMAYFSSLCARCFARPRFIAQMTTSGRRAKPASVLASEEGVECESPRIQPSTPSSRIRTYLNTYIHAYMHTCIHTYVHPSTHPIHATQCNAMQCMHLCIPSSNQYDSMIHIYVNVGLKLLFTHTPSPPTPTPAEDRLHGGRERPRRRRDLRLLGALVLHRRVPGAAGQGPPGCGGGAGGREGGGSGGGVGGEGGCPRCGGIGVLFRLV